MQKQENSGFSNKLTHYRSAGKSNGAGKPDRRQSGKLSEGRQVLLCGSYAVGLLVALAVRLWVCALSRTQNNEQIRGVLWDRFAKTSYPPGVSAALARFPDQLRRK